MWQSLKLQTHHICTESGLWHLQLPKPYQSLSQFCSNEVNCRACALSLAGCLLILALGSAIFDVMLFTVKFAMEDIAGQSQPGRFFEFICGVQSHGGQT